MSILDACPDVVQAAAFLTAAVWHAQVASADFDRQGQEYDKERLIEQITETLKVWLCLFVLVTECDRQPNVKSVLF